MMKIRIKVKNCTKNKGIIKYMIIRRDKKNKKEKIVKRRKGGLRSWI